MAEFPRDWSDLEVATRLVAAAKRGKPDVQLAEEMRERVTAMHERIGRCRCRALDPTEETP